MLLFHLPSHAQCNFGEACAINERMVGSAVLYYELLSWWWRCKSPKKTPEVPDIQIIPDKEGMRAQPLRNSCGFTYHVHQPNK